MSDSATSGVRFKDEIASAAYEPLLPIEKKLVGWSLGLGIVLLVILGAVSRL